MKTLGVMFVCVAIVSKNPVLFFMGLIVIITG